MDFCRAGTKVSRMVPESLLHDVAHTAGQFEVPRIESPRYLPAPSLGIDLGTISARNHTCLPISPTLSPFLLLSMIGVESTLSNKHYNAMNLLAGELFARIGINGACGGSLP